MDNDIPCALNIYFHGLNNKITAFFNAYESIHCINYKNASLKIN